MLIALALSVLVQQQTWTKGGPAEYVLVEAKGSALDAAGATLTLRADTSRANGFGTIVASVPADSFRGRRVRISAEIQAQRVTGRASPWLRVDGASGMLSLDNGMEDGVRGTSSGHREMTLFVPPEATKLVFGLLMSGSGEATARTLRIEARPAIAANAPLAPPAKALLDSALSVVRKNSLWRDTVSWSTVEPKVRAIAAGAETTQEVYPAIRALLGSLGDHHSFLMLPSATQQFTTGGAQNPRPEVKVLGDSIGYISVPAYSGGEINAARAYVVETQAAIEATLPRTTCRWVVDLRGNGGGNMWPMLGGLRPFLGEAGLGSFVDAKGPGPLWHAKDAVDVTPTPALARLDSSYVAVLTGPRTGSSGEAVTISFIGRPRTRSFGLPTAGLSTANSGFRLPDGSMIQLTVAVEADRNGFRYGERIGPSEVVADTAAQLAAATAWLKAQPACKR